MKQINKNSFWLFLFFTGLFFVFFLPPLDPDLGWHLKCGEFVLKKGYFCNFNQFSTLLANYKWINTYLIYQALVFLIYQWFNLWGLSFLGAIILTFPFLIFFTLIKNRFWQKILAILLIIFLSFGTLGLGVRSQLFSFFYFPVVVKLIILSKKDKRWLFLLPLVFLFWVNSHGGFVLGLIPFAIYCFLTLWPFLRKEEDFYNFRVVSLVIVLTLFSTLLNPYGFGVYQEALRHFIFPLNTLIAEWVPLSLFQFLLISCSSLFFIYLTTQKKPFRLNFLKASLFFFLILAFKARRNVPYFYFLFFLNLFNLQNKKILVLKKKPWFGVLGKLLILFTLYQGIIIQLPKTIKINQNWQSFCQNGYVNYPCGAVNFLKKEAHSGNLFNRYEWGGFLIWQLSEFKVFVDGRMPAWRHPSGKSPYTIYLEVLQTKNGWQETLDHHNIDWILISPGTFMDLKLKVNPKSFGWDEVYRDQISVIYKKK